MPKMYKPGQPKKQKTTTIKKIRGKNLNELYATGLETGEVGFIDVDWDAYDSVPVSKEFFYTETIPDEWNLKK